MTDLEPTSAHPADGSQRSGPARPAAETAAHPADAATATAISDPGLEPHVERYSDTNRALGRSVYFGIVTLFGLVAPLMGLLFLIGYFAIPKDTWINILIGRVNAQHLVFGLTLGLGLLVLGIGAERWAKSIMSDREMVEHRHPSASSPEGRAEFARQWNDGVADSGITRRGLLLKTLIGGALAVTLPALVTLSDLGPYPTPSTRRRTLMRTLWAEGVRLVNDVTMRPIKAADMEIGQLVNAEPENLKDLHGVEHQQAKAKAALIIVRMDPERIKIPDSRKDWHVGGILAYSKICTHVGCPISLWEQQTHNLLCPCHQSTFDLGNSGTVVFGPAARALPQLPITVDKDGYLVARSDFTVPVGPSFFERDSRGDFKEGDR